MEIYQSGKRKPSTRQERIWVIGFILMVAFLLALLIWWHFDHRIEKLKSGTIMQIILLQGPVIHSPNNN